MPDEESRNEGEARLGAWGWFAIFALLAILAVAIWYCIHAWSEMAGVGISTAGWIFLLLGVALTIVVGGGLMALLFYSSRKGKDF